MPTVVTPTGGGTGTRELVVLDPVEIDATRTPLYLTPDVDDGPIHIRMEGVDWGDAEIAAYMAELSRGELPVDYRIPNRKITIPLQIRSLGGVSFTTARVNLQQKVGLIQREGGWLLRQLVGGDKLFLDVVNATLGMGGSTFQAYKDFDLEVDLVLETLPDWYGEELTL